MDTCPKCNSSRVVYVDHREPARNQQWRNGHTAFSGAGKAMSRHPVGALLTLAAGAAVWIGHQAYEHLSKGYKCEACGHKFK